MNTKIELSPDFIEEIRSILRVTITDELLFDVIERLTGLWEANLHCDLSDILNDIEEENNPEDE